MKFDKPVYIVAARRSPIGRFGGGLATVPARDLALQVAEATVDDSLRPSVDHVILGQVLSAGTGMNIARQIALRLGLPQETPGFTVNMVCGSGLKAVVLGAQQILMGESELVLTGGVESMSNAPHYCTQARFGNKLGNGTLLDGILTDGLTDPILSVSMGETAENIAEKFRITRAEQDEFAALSQVRAAKSVAHFVREIAPILTVKGSVSSDEQPRPDSSFETLGKLRPAFMRDGTVTAGNASTINDGAAMLVLASEAACTRNKVHPRVVVRGSTVTGCDPALMGLGPVGAIRQLCTELKWSLENVDAVEINEAFAVQTIACARELGIPLEKLNQRGGAIALGHPIGASGARVLVTLLHLMEDRDYKRGIASLCVGGGMGIAVAIELVG